MLSGGSSWATVSVGWGEKERGKEAKPGKRLEDSMSLRELEGETMCGRKGGREAGIRRAEGEAVVRVMGEGKEERWEMA
eukprot:scaffold141517_cov35-Tisochrysis_lutea.AAC.1